MGIRSRSNWGREIAVFTCFHRCACISSYICTKPRFVSRVRPLWRQPLAYATPPPPKKKNKIQNKTNKQETDSIFSYYMNLRNRHKLCANVQTHMKASCCWSAIWIHHMHTSTAGWFIDTASFCVARVLMQSGLRVRGQTLWRCSQNKQRRAAG